MRVYATGDVGRLVDYAAFRRRAAAAAGADSGAAPRRPACAMECLGDAAGNAEGGEAEWVLELVGRRDTQVKVRPPALPGPSLAQGPARQGGAWRRRRSLGGGGSDGTRGAAAAEDYAAANGASSRQREIAPSAANGADSRVRCLQDA